MALKEPPVTVNEGSTVGPGTRLNGVFEIDELVAVGGMGHVYRGRALETGDSVAIKMIRPELAENDTYLALFRKEASALHRTPHDAIVRYYVFTTDPDLQRPYLAMEFVEGESLSSLLKRQPLDLASVRVLQRRIAAGLDAAHRLGVVHRDVSPDNIILPKNDPHRAKLIDFGIARDSLGGATVIGDEFAGKSNFASPEQIGLFGGLVTSKTDIYSLGLTLAAALLGAPIKMSGTMADLVVLRQKVPDLSGIDPSFRPLLERMLQPDPAQRPANMAEVAAWPNQPAPENTVTALSLPRAVPASVEPQPAPAQGWSPWVFPGVLASVAVLGLGFATWYFLGATSSDKMPQKDAVAAQMAPASEPLASQSAHDPASNAVSLPTARPNASAPVAAVVPPPPPVGLPAPPVAAPLPAEATPAEPPAARVPQAIPPAPAASAALPIEQPAPPAIMPPQDVAAAKPEPVLALPSVKPATAIKLAARSTFRDCPTCPELIALPAGNFMMGSNSDPTERPVHKATVAALAIGRFPVTVGEWRLCVADKGCSFNPEGDPETPVHNLSWDDAQQYVTWLSHATGHTYRLPTEAEWEYAARGGTDTRYWWGNQFEPKMAACRSCVQPVPSDPPKAGIYPANAFGLHDVTGSVAQWVADCWHKDFRGVPADGSAWVAPRCAQRVLRGGSWSGNPGDLRISGREYYDQTVRYPGHGLRVAREM